MSLLFIFVILIVGVAIAFAIRKMGEQARRHDEAKELLRQNSIDMRAHTLAKYVTDLHEAAAQREWEERIRQVKNVRCTKRRGCKCE